MDSLNFNARYVILTSLGYISNFKTVCFRGKNGFSYDMDWDLAQRSYFSAEDARKIQKSLRAPARIEDESSYVFSLMEKLTEGLMNLSEIQKCYCPCTLQAA